MQVSPRDVRMKLSIADQLALIYTSAGSQRKIADFTGLSHQTIGRILHAQASGRSLAAYEKRPDLVAAIDAAFDLHKDLTRRVARQHALPYDPQAPIYAERLALKKRAVIDRDGNAIFQGDASDVRKFLSGRTVRKIDKETGEILREWKATPAQIAGGMREAIIRGERVLAQHLHWVRDDIRKRWVTTSQKSGAYHNISGASVVNLPSYMKTARQRIVDYLNRGGLPTREAIKARNALQKLVAAGVKLQRVMTPYTATDPRQDPDLVWQELQEKQQRHAPAVGAPGTAFADQYLLQVNTQTSNEAKPQKARRGSRATKRRSPSR